MEFTGAQRTSVLPTGSRMLPTSHVQLGKQAAPRNHSVRLCGACFNFVVLGDKRDRKAGLTKLWKTSPNAQQ
jgi:hypothetical protein